MKQPQPKFNIIGFCYNVVGFTSVKNAKEYSEDMLNYFINLLI